MNNSETSKSNIPRSTFRGLSRGAFVCGTAGVLYYLWYRKVNEDMKKANLSLKEHGHLPSDDSEKGRRVSP